MLEFFFPFSLLNYYASLSNKHNCIFCILHCVSWTTMHAWSTMDGPTWKGKLLLATQIVSYLMIKEQGGTSVALWTTNHTTERQQDYWTEVNCFSQPRHSTCSFSENIYTFKDFSLMSPERTTNKWRLYFQGIFSWSYCAIFPQGTMKFHYSDEQWEYKVDHNTLYRVT